jgi:hypothetical protein
MRDGGKGSVEGMGGNGSGGEGEQRLRREGRA